jgi:archaeosortase B (VPXXXP-CTERM-specific)
LKTAEFKEGISLAKSEGEKKSKSRQVEHKGKSKSIAPLSKKDVASILVEKVSENSEALRYITLFLAFWLTFSLFYYLLTLRGSLSLLKNLTALILGEIFSVGGASVVVEEAMVSINGFGLEIIDECTAVFSAIVYCSCVLAYPTTLKNKGLGILCGVPSLYAINILRLVVLVLVGIFHPNMFEFVHVYLWQASFIIFVVVLFLLWLHFLSEERTCAN